MSEPKDKASVLVDIHSRLESFAKHPPVEEALASIARISSTLDPLQEYPSAVVESQFKTPLGHMVSLLQEYFHGADGGDDAYIRNRLFAMVGEMLERNGKIERDLAWVIPRLLEPLMASRGWSAMINPAGVDYAVGVGHTLAPLIPQVLSADILAKGSDALVCFTKTATSCDPAWHVLEMVSPAYLDLIVEGARPVLSSRSMLRDVNKPTDDQPRPGMRL